MGQLCRLVGLAHDLIGRAQLVSGLPRQRQRPLARRADRADVQRRDERPCLKALLLPALGARRLVQIEHGQLSKIVTARARSRLISVMSP